jgi:hypothetical protein
MGEDTPLYCRYGTVVDVQYDIENNRSVYLGKVPCSLYLWRNCEAKPSAMSFERLHVQSRKSKRGPVQSCAMNALLCVVTKVRDREDVLTNLLSLLGLCNYNI